MTSRRNKNLVFLLILTVLSAAALVVAAREDASGPGGQAAAGTRLADAGILGVSARLVQKKVLQGSEGTVEMELELNTDETPLDADRPAQHVDLVLVLDRSGSMSGTKIRAARRAVLDLIDRLSAGDRLALLSYAEHARTHFGLLPVTGANRKLMVSALQHLTAAGGTNLGAGLDAGIQLLERSARRSVPGKLILISDGLANRGVVAPGALGNMAARTADREFAVSTVGVGEDFNEFLLTTIADRGAGNYHYLDDPDAFAEVLWKEFHFSRTALARGVTVFVPLVPDVDLVNASGYPLTRTADGILFQPGSLGNGQNRRLYLTFRLPTANLGRIEIPAPQVSYRYSGRTFRTTPPGLFAVACVADRHQVLSSIDPAGWADKVLQEDFNRLRQQVAADIKSGEKDRAFHRIDSYYRRQSEINAAVKSERVSRNLAGDLEHLREKVDATFSGAPAAVEQKQKSAAKSLQYQGYSGRRQNRPATQ